MLDWIFEGIVTWISSVVSDMMDAVSGLFLQALGTDMTAMEEYFPFVSKAFTVMQYTAWALLFLITVWQLFRVFGGPVTEAENPWVLLGRSALFAFLIGYAKPIFLLTLKIATAPYTALMDIQMTAEDFTFAGIEQALQNGLTSLIATISVVGLLLLTILEIALGWNYFKLLLETVERYIVVGVLCYTSPLAFSMGASKATTPVFRSWCRMVGSQLLLLVMNVWFLRGFSTSVGQYIGTGGALSNGNGNVFLWLFCAVAFLKTAQKFDSYLAAMGLNVAQTGSGMGMELLMAARVITGVAGGARSAGSVFRGGSAATGTGAAATGFAAGFANRFKGNSYVRDAVVDGGTRMGAGGTIGFVGRAFGGIAVFGASGTMKSRAIIRNALFQALRRGESVIVTDSKGELYADTSEMFRNEEYDVKIYNLVSPEHGDSWNCMSDLNGDTLMAQVLTNVIIGNTSSGKGDHFWDNGEGNLLKALILLIDQDRTRSPDMKHLPAVYQLLTQNSERQLTAMFDKLPLDHPARAPFNLFAQSSDTVRSGIILGLGTRLQVLQNQAVQRITSQSDIDLTAPGRNKCIYYIVLSDQDATMAFLSSLFFSFMFIKLTRYADGRPNGRCDVPVNLILDEFNNVGRIGGAEDGSDFARSLSVVRSRNIRVMLTVQSLGQLQNRYPKNLWSEIIGNCDIQLMLGCTDDVTAEYISARSGDMSVQVNSTMTVRQTIAVAQVIPQYRHTEGQGRRRLLTPDEVLRLPNEELLCIIRGHNILKLNKLDFTKHPMAKQIVKASVYDYKPTADTMIPEPIRSDIEPTPPKKAAHRKSLYSSAQPPSEF